MINKSDEIYNQTQITNKQDIWMHQINIEAVDQKQINYVSHYNPSQKEMTNIIQRSYQWSGSMYEWCGYNQEYIYRDSKFVHNNEQEKQRGPFI